MRRVVSPLVFCAALGGGQALAQTTQLVSANSQNAPANSTATEAAVSGDGMRIAFQSNSNNLVAGDSNNTVDVFLRDVASGATIRVSLADSGAEANDHCDRLGISRDGQRVVFGSRATNLVAGDSNGAWDVFVRDIPSSTTVRVTVDSNGNESNATSIHPALSGDGRVAAFVTAATNLDPNDLNVFADAYVHDTNDGTTTRVSVAPGGLDPDGASEEPVLSYDGRYVVFRSYASNLAGLDTNNALDVFRFDRVTSQTARVSVTPTGAYGDKLSGSWTPPAISDDGRYVAFGSDATNLVAGDTNGVSDVFLRDMVLGRTTLVSVGASGPANSLSFFGGMSGDGRLIAFDSFASNLVAGDANSFTDVFVRDLSNQTTALASVGVGGAWPDYHCVASTISGDGRVVAFQSSANNLVATPTSIWVDVFARDWAGTDVYDVFCAGDGGAANCPCGNFGEAWSGCANSSGPGGAKLTATGSTQPDSLALHVSGLPTNATAILFQGSTIVPPLPFGDGLRCLFGTVRRLHVGNATNGAISFPGAGEPSISARSAALSDVLTPGTTRGYQVYYRDGAASFCPAPAGGTFSASNGIRVTW